MLNELVKLSAPSNNHIMKSQPPTSTAFAFTRDCYHAGIPNTDAELIKRTVRGGSNHSFAASYQRFDADIRRAELNDEALPPFAELESHLLNIDESRGLTLPSQNHRNYNQHANAARGHQSHHFQPRHNQTTQRVFTQRQQQAFSSILRPYSNPSSNNQTATNHRDHRKTIRARSDLLQILRDHHSTTRINVVHHHPPAAIQPASTKQSTTFPTDIEPQSTSISQRIHQQPSAQPFQCRYNRLQ
ncbi:hypothetical protein MHU86_6016 [Fragilaria crotonensis]|nr:hypothetical protein MHU86_6016 [Fragilaria crotonensis]